MLLSIEECNRTKRKIEALETVMKKGENAVKKRGGCTIFI